MTERKLPESLGLPMVTNIWKVTAIGISDQDYASAQMALLLAYDRCGEIKPGCQERAERTIRHFLRRVKGDPCLNRENRVGGLQRPLAGIDKLKL